MAADTLSQEQKDFLEQCEEELKDRFTDKDEEFMAVFNAAVPDPPIVDPWHGPGQRRNNRNDRRHQHREQPYRRGSGPGHDRGHRDDGYERHGGGGYQRRDRRPY